MCVYSKNVIYLAYFIIYVYNYFNIYIICFNILYYDLNNPQIEKLCSYIIS